MQLTDLDGGKSPVEGGSFVLDSAQTRMDDVQVGDTGGSLDGGRGVDGGLTPEGGTPDDASRRVDGNITADGSPPVDATVAVDGGVLPDAAGDAFQPDAGSVLVAGCVNPCSVGPCFFPGTATGTLIGTGEHLFPVPIEGGPGFSCGATVRIGETVRIEVEVASGYSFDTWSPGVGQLLFPCPCEGQSVLVCEFVVTEPVYCGAVFAAL